jgi:hypothetical protein
MLFSESWPLLLLLLLLLTVVHGCADGCYAADSTNAFGDCLVAMATAGRSIL